jgi:hypothetical protein
VTTNPPACHVTPIRRICAHASRMRGAGLVLGEFSLPDAARSQEKRPRETASAHLRVSPAFSSGHSSPERARIFPEEDWLRRESPPSPRGCGTACATRHQGQCGDSRGD